MKLLQEVDVKVYSGLVIAVEASLMSQYWEEVAVFLTVILYQAGLVELEYLWI